MRIWKAGVLLVFTALLILNIITSFGTRLDSTMPNIELESDEIHVSIHDDRSVLLNGVSANDGKDGDLSDRVIVESISRFIDVGTSKVTYAVWDDDDHVVKTTRKVIYDDYTEPEFYLRGSLIFSTAQSANTLRYLGAVDSMDGDISGRIIITSSDYMVSTANVFYVNARVTSSMGGSASIDLPVLIEERDVEAPTIELSKYLMFAQVGEEVDMRGNLAAAYVVSEDDDGEEIKTYMTSSVRIDSDLDTDTPGIYLVHYYVTAYDESGKDHKAHETLTVIVEGEDAK